jgi:putative endonuclease
MMRRAPIFFKLSIDSLMSWQLFGCVMSYWVYILASGKHGTLYVGMTNDLGRRIQQHRLGQGSGFVKQHGIGRLVYVEPYDRALDAIEREKLKRWRRDWKIALIEKDNLDWNDLSGLIVE